MSNTILDSFLHNEVYVLGPDEDLIGADTIFITNQWDVLVDHMKMLSPETEGESILVHGFLTTADVLPPSLYGKTAYLIINDNSVRKDMIDGIVIPLEEATQPKHIARQIEDIINGFFNNENVSNIDPGIDDIYILYGYRIELCIAPNEDDEDEEAIQTCKEIIADIDGILARNKQKLGPILEEWEREDFVT